MTAADWNFAGPNVNVAHDYPCLRFWKRSAERPPRTRQNRYELRLRRNGHATTKKRGH